MNRLLHFGLVVVFQNQIWILTRTPGGARVVIWVLVEGCAGKGSKKLPEGSYFRCETCKLHSSFHQFLLCGWVYSFDHLGPQLSVWLGIFWVLDKFARGCRICRNLWATSALTWLPVSSSHLRFLSKSREESLWGSVSLMGSAPVFRPSMSSLPISFEGNGKTGQLELTEQKKQVGSIKQEAGHHIWNWIRIDWTWLIDRRIGPFLFDQTLTCNHTARISSRVSALSVSPDIWMSPRSLPLFPDGWH